MRRDRGRRPIAGTPKPEVVGGGEVIDIKIVDSREPSSKPISYHIVVSDSCYVRPSARASEAREIDVAAIYAERRERDELVRDHELEAHRGAHVRKCGALTRELNVTKQTRASRSGRTR